MKCNDSFFRQSGIITESQRTKVSDDITKLYCYRWSLKIGNISSRCPLVMAAHTGRGNRIRIISARDLADRRLRGQWRNRPILKSCSPSPISTVSECSAHNKLKFKLTARSAQTKSLHYHANHFSLASSIPNSGLNKFRSSIGSSSKIR